MLTRSTFTHITDRYADGKQPTSVIDQHIALLEAHAAELARMSEDIKARVPTVDETTNSHDEARAHAMRGDLRLLEDGVSESSPISDERLNEFVGLPGLIETRRWLERLRVAREEAVARESVSWPRSFRLKDGKSHYSAGRRYKAGDVVELTETQAEAFADKFEPAEAATS
ncbi:MAG TPA: hypothetical protein VM364_18615 [Vicinamibacterales bacterium]|nr:hypothetical protein [Vicinamibacterales bacterium]